MTDIHTKITGDSFPLVLLPLVLVPAIFYNTTSAMVHVWMVNETFVHGFVVFPLVIWLIWKKRSQISLIKPRPEPRVAIILLALLIIWLVSSMVDIEIAQQFLMITIILTTVWITTGRRVFLYVFFPLIFLYFAVPFGQVLIPPLMEYTAYFTVTLIRMVGIPVYQDGFTFVLPTGSWSIVEECSGVRYLIASFSLGSIYAYINYSSTKKRIIFILLSIIVPIVGNGIRAFGIVMIGHYSGMKLAVGADHLLYGWVFFGVIIFLLFYVGSFWQDSGELTEDACEHDQASAAKYKKNHSFEILLLSILVMLLTMMFSGYVKNSNQEAIGRVALQFPADFSGWQYESGRSLGWQPIFVNPDAVISRGYSLRDDFVQLDVAYYQAQKQGAEAISTNNKISNPHGGKWKLVSSVRIVDDDMTYIESELKKMDTKLLVWSWYRVGDYEESSPYLAKALQVYNLIVEERSDAALVSIAIQVTDTKVKARKKLHGFWEMSARDIAEVFEEIRNE